MIINLLIGTTTDRHQMTVEDTSTINAAMESCKEQYGTIMNTGRVTLNELFLVPSDFNKTFADFGITETAILFGGQKGDGGNFISL